MVDYRMHIEFKKKAPTLRHRVLPRLHHLAGHAARRTDIANTACLDNVTARSASQKLCHDVSPQAFAILPGGK
jgi:hypothetical protein